MKFKFILFVLGILFFHNTIDAQQANRVQRGQRGYVPPPKFNNDAYIDKKDPHEEAAIIVPVCVEAFSLDAFQKEIFKGLLMQKIEDDNVILLDEKNTREQRKKKLDERNKFFYNELTTILTLEQVEEYKHIDFSEHEKDLKKKKKKNKRKKNQS